MRNGIYSKLYLILFLFLLVNSCKNKSDNENHSTNEINQLDLEKNEIELKSNQSDKKNDQLVIVIKDSIPLRTEPNSQAQISKYAFISLQLQVLEISKNNTWYKVKIGEDKGRHKEEYWVFHEDVYQEPKNSIAEVTLDLSVFESGDLQDAMRIDSEDYIYKLNSLNLDTSYYIGSTYKSYQMSCSQPFSICAKIFEPDHYFLFEGDEKHTDAEDLAVLENRYRHLYENGTVIPFYRIESELDIETIHEKLICAKIIMDDPDCYPDKYIGTVIDELTNQNHTVNGNYYLSSLSINTDYLFSTKLNGGVQNLDFLYILTISYSDMQTETIVRRISLSWPLCL
ncbi:MAG: hypothetical protein ABII90_11145 [Bacteroidota bacterium]